VNMYFANSISNARVWGEKRSDLRDF
jgi:hypothetical protein